MKTLKLSVILGIIGLFFYLTPNAYSQNCDTLRNYVPDSSFYQLSTSDGLILGQDELSDGIYTYYTDKWAEKYSVSTPTLITGVRFAPWKVQDNTGSSVVKIQIFSDAGLEPGTVVEEKIVPYSTLTVNSWNMILFDNPVTANGSFWVGYQIPVSKPFNEFALLGTKSTTNHTMAHLIGIYDDFWMETSDIYSDAGGNDLNVAFVMDILGTTNFPTASFTVDDVESCESGVFTVNAGNSVNGVNYNWILTDAGVTNIYVDFNGSANDVVSPTTSNPSSQTLFLWLDGECFSYDIDVIQVDVYPDVAGTVTSLPETCGDGNGTIEFTNASGGNGSYLYSIDGGTTTDSNPLFTNVAPGTYNVEISTGGNGCSDSQTVTVGTQAAAALTTNTSVSICEGDSTTLTATGNGTIEWFDNGGQSLGTNNSLVVNPLTTSFYDVVLTTSDGCTDNAQVTVTVNPSPSVSLVATNTSFCEGGSATLTASGTQSYSWDNGLGTGDTQTVSPTATTTYTVTGTDANGCSSTEQVTINVTPLDDATFHFQDSIFCQAGTTAIPQISGLPGGSFSAGAGLVIDVSTGEINISGSQLGTYTVSYLTDGVCPNTGTQTISIISTPDATFSYSANEFCQNDGIVSPAFSGGAMGGTFTSTNGLSLSGNGNIDLVGSTPGSYTITNTIAASSTCPEVSGTFDIKVKESPIVNAGSDQVVCDGDQVVLSATTSGGTISWDQGVVDGASFTASGVGSTTYTVTADLDGCTATDQVTVLVDPCLGIENEEFSTISIFPNPSSGIINLKSEEQIKAESIHLISMDGKTVVASFEQVSNNLIQLDVSHLVKGVYFVQITTNKAQLIKKISIQ